MKIPGQALKLIIQRSAKIGPTIYLETQHLLVDFIERLKFSSAWPVRSYTVQAMFLTCTACRI